MSKMRMLNKWQINNIEILDPITLAGLRLGNWHNAPTGILCCSECGGPGITMPIVSHFNYDATKITCYRCQQQTRQKINSKLQTYGNNN